MKLLHRLTGLLLFLIIFAGTLAALSEIVRGDAVWAATLGRLGEYRIEILLGCLGVVFLLVVYALTSIRMPERVQYFAYDMEGGGSVSISLKAMQEFVARIGDEFSQVVSLHPVLKAVSGSVDVQLDVKVKSGAQIPELCRMLQDRVRECIKQNVGISDIRDVRVRVQEIVLSPSAGETAGSDAKVV